MITPHEAWRRILGKIAPLTTERVSLVYSLNCVLAEGVSADRDIPACDRSAMDGYAIRASDADIAAALLTVVDEVPAGSSRKPAMSAGECVRIFTGACIPPDADTVVMQEHVESTSSAAGVAQIRILKPVKKGQHIFRRGENAVSGEVLVHPGTRLNASHVSLCASVGCDNPLVFRKPKTTVLTTGAELKKAGDSAEEHEIRDSNGPMLSAVLAANSFPCTCTTVSDELEQVVDAIAAAFEESDVLLVTGGVSVGKYDLVEEAIVKAGGEVVYHGVGIKPGKPQLFAVFTGGKYLFGLPGNPLSSMVGMHEFALPALWRLAGLPEEDCRRLFRLPIVSSVQSKGDRVQLVLARHVLRDSGSCVEPVPSSGSADLVAAGKADGVIMMPAGTNQISAGEIVDFRSWGGIA